MAPICMALRARAAIVLNGHEHHMQRRRPIGEWLGPRFWRRALPPPTAI